MRVTATRGIRLLASPWQVFRALARNLTATLDYTDVPASSRSPRWPAGSDSAERAFSVLRLAANAGRYLYEDSLLRGSGLDWMLALAIPQSLDLTRTQLHWRTANSNALRLLSEQAGVGLATMTMRRDYEARGIRSVALTGSGRRGDYDCTVRWPQSMSCRFECKGRSTPDSKAHTSAAQQKRAGAPSQALALALCSMVPRAGASNLPRVVVLDPSVKPKAMQDDQAALYCIGLGCMWAGATTFGQAVLDVVCTRDEPICRPAARPECASRFDSRTGLLEALEQQRAWSSDGWVESEILRHGDFVLSTACSVQMMEAVAQCPSLEGAADLLTEVPSLGSSPQQLVADNGDGSALVLRGPIGLLLEEEAEKVAPLPPWSEYDA